MQSTAIERVVQLTTGIVIAIAMHLQLLCIFVVKIMYFLYFKYFFPFDFF